MVKYGLKEESEVFKTDGLFKRLTKSKDDYYKEGEECCGAYYGAVLKNKVHEFKNKKIILEAKNQRLDLLVKNLKEEVKILKERTWRKNNTSEEKVHNENLSTCVGIRPMTLEDEVLNMIENVYKEDEVIVNEYSYLIKEYEKETSFALKEEYKNGLFETYRTFK